MPHVHSIEGSQKSCAEEEAFEQFGLGAPEHVG
jgi:hypothetical protein